MKNFGEKLASYGALLLYLSIILLSFGCSSSSSDSQSVTFATTIRETTAYIKAEMEKAGLPCEVKGRYKHFFSIRQKMLSQNLGFEEVYDIWRQKYGK
jgi:hypothetical protein